MHTKYRCNPVTAEDITLSPEETERLRRDIDYHILPPVSGAPTSAFPLTFGTRSLVQGMDKTASDILSS